GLVALSALSFAVGGSFLYDWFWGTGYHVRAAEQALQQRHFDEAKAHISLCLNARPKKPEVQLLAARVKRRSIFPVLPGGVDGPGACLTAGGVSYGGSYDEVEQHLAEYAELGGLTELLNLEQNLLRAQAGELSMIVKSGN